ncbi:multidrug MFS transporter [Actibacterium mucosum KCTC 23349]|uniref:Bcr/CflA family efflux transporter n=1 Tax=Actibacterium mucosum KCTC 23349 TaxID=1454373 RepID=A0A037ZK67_9RHOB|nr:multidrug effflux MFS transporter [Actibacterium mucosum]KAJ56493.1 multidrug MFS transporter [Actibacterium mucosum KCTC 23349]
MSSEQPARFLDRSTPPHVVTLVLMAGLSAAAMNLFLPSLPSLAAHFDVEYGTIGLAVGLYLAVNAPMQILIGPLSDRYGRRAITLIGFAVFVVATLGCILAPNVEVFLLMRMLQATAVAGIVIGRAVIRDVVSNPDDAASMIGYVTMGMALVPMVAPALGGVLDTYFGWQATFVALLIMGMAMLTLVWADMGETFTPRPITLAKQFSEYPELFRSRRFWGYALISGFSSGAFFAYLGGGPKIGEEVYGLTPAMVGAFFGMPALGYMMGNFLSGRFSGRLGLGRMIFAGTYTVSAGMLLALFTTSLNLGHPLAFFGPMVLLGLGNGLVIPNATAGMISVRPHLAGSASGLGGAIMLGGGATLSMIAGNLMDHGAAERPLLLLMLASSVAGIVTMLYVRHVDRKEAAATA